MTEKAVGAEPDFPSKEAVHKQQALQNQIENTALGSTPAAGPSAYNPCRCPECRLTVKHWRCDTCGSGPFDRRNRRPRYTRNAKDDKDRIVGLIYACSDECAYQDQITHMQELKTAARRRGDMQTVKELTAAIQEKQTEQIIKKAKSKRAVG
jgi:hypothetical protein